MAAYPKATIPTQPVLSFAAFFNESKQRVPSVLDVPNVKFVTSGRIAIALALSQMRIGKGDKVLVPAYHCGSMVEPVLWAGATPVFYKVQGDTSVDLLDIAGKIDASTRALMTTNYFGFPQDLSKIRQLCDEHNIFMLEDCAHSFFGEHAGKPLGSYGDYAIASSMKFFPIYEGGCLLSSTRTIDNIHLTSAGPAFEAKAAFNALEKGFEYNRMRLLQGMLMLPMWLKNFIWRSIKKGSAAKKISLGPGSSDGAFEFEPKWLTTKSAKFSRYLLRLTSKSRIALKRRQHYLSLQDALSGLPGCRPLFPSLPDGVVPWVFPVVVETGEELISALKNAGVPVVRFGEFLWQGVDEGICPSSVHLSRHAIQFPCHQELRTSELNWMIDQIRSAFLTNGKASAN